MISRWLDSDFMYSLLRTPTALISMIVCIALAACALFAPWLAQQHSRRSPCSIFSTQNCREAGESPAGP